MQQNTSVSATRSKAPSNPRRSAHAAWPWIAVGALALGLWAGAALAPRSAAPIESDARAEGAERETPRRANPSSQLGRLAPAKLAPAPAPAASADAADITLEERARREALTASLMGKLRSRIRNEAAFALEPTPEGTAQRMTLVAEGWAEALMVLAPELVEDEVSAAISDGLCDPKSNGAELMVLAHLDRALPGTLKGEAVDCVIARKQEDVALWSVLDSWRRTGAALTPAMQKLAESAQDPRTQRRFMDQATESALRAQTAANTVNRVAVHARGPVVQPTEPSAPERKP